MAASTSASVLADTPVMPSAAKSLSVSAGEVVPPVAVTMRPATVVAKASILATVLISAAATLPMASFSKARPELLKPAAVLAPMAA